MAAYRIREGGELTELNSRPTGGEGACYVAVEPEGRCVLVANFAGGTVASFPVRDDGRLGPAGSVVRHDGTEPHPHATVPGPEGESVYVPDLGNDRVVGYRAAFERATLDPAGVPDTELPDGAGPRHLEFGPEGKYAFLVNELDATLTSLSYDPEAGTLTPVETAAMRPPDADPESVAADVHVHPTGEWVYASLRGHDTVVRFDIGEDGRFGEPVHTPTGGAWPRDIALSPDGEILLAENNHSDTVVSFAISSDGSLQEQTATAIPGPTCLVFAGRQ